MQIFQIANKVLFLGPPPFFLLETQSKLHTLDLNTPLTFFYSLLTLTLEEASPIFLQTLTF